jgi:triacylglycerol lipase
MTVVLVDGIWGTGAIFGRLRGELTAHGHVCLVPSLRPSNAVHGVADLAAKLSRYIDTHAGANAPLTIVGFSLGCIVARYYLQQLGGYRRTRAFFALAGPHRGTWTAYGYLGQGARDLRPGSTLLRLLDSSCPCLSCVALHAYWTPFDLMIVPATSARWREASNLRVLTPLHRFLPTSRRVQRDILRHLQRLG